MGRGRVLRYATMEPKVWIDGALVPRSEATIDVYDLSLLRGYGIYEGLAAHDGEPFRFRDHWERFGRSAKALDLAIPYTGEEVLAAMRALVKENAPHGRAIIRMILTGGNADGGIVHVAGREQLYLLSEPMRPYPIEWYERGAHAITHAHRRAFPEFKTIDYTVAVMLQSKMKQAGAAEAVYISDGNVLECTGSNIFCVRNSALVTPKDEMLHGITRNVTLELAREAGLTIEERALPLEELLAANEVFITSSFKDIVPLRSIDDTLITAPGPISKDLMARFLKYAETFRN